MSSTSIHLFLLASSLVPASPIGPLGVRASQSARRVSVGKWVYPGSNEKRDDVLAALDDKAAGVDLHISVGDSVVSGQPLCTVHADAPGDLSYALDYAAANRTL